MLKTKDSPITRQVADQVVSGTKKVQPAADRVVEFFNNFSYEPDRKRKRVLFGMKIGIPAVIGGLLGGIALAKNWNKSAGKKD